MKRFWLRITAWTCAVVCGACTAAPDRTASLHLSDYEQTVAQLHITTRTDSDPAPDTTPTPPVTTNFSPQYGMWFTANDYPEILTGYSAADFSAAISDRFAQAAAIGINTVYVQVRAFADAYYPSRLFAPGLFQSPDCDYDPLALMIEAAHAQGLSFHAWINPLRCMSEVQMQEMDAKFPIKQWYLDPEKKGSLLSLVGDRYWLNPAYPEVRRLIAEGAAEIVRGYAVDGIQIDDYFYPTTDPGFDAAAFAMSGGSDLRAFRYAQCNAMVQELYQAIHTANPDVLFGISPQGTLRGNETQYADVQTWCSTPGYCDYLLPQIYFGLQNETAPFADTVTLWQHLVTAPEVQLIIGICTYKLGKEDAYAGTGKQEWIRDTSVSSKELRLVKEQGLGAALYSYASTFQPEAAHATPMQQEVDAFAALLVP